MKLETVFHIATVRNSGGWKNILTKHPLFASGIHLFVGGGGNSKRSMGPK